MRTVEWTGELGGRRWSMVGSVRSHPGRHGELSAFGHQSCDEFEVAWQFTTTDRWAMRTFDVRVVGDGLNRTLLLERTEAGWRSTAWSGDRPPISGPVLVGSGSDQPRADHHRAEQPRADQHRAEQPRADQHRAEQPRADQHRADQPRADQPGADVATPDVIHRLPAPGLTIDEDAEHTADVVLDDCPVTHLVPLRRLGLTAPRTMIRGGSPVPRALASAIPALRIELPSLAVVRTRQRYHWVADEPRAIRLRHAFAGQEPTPLTVDQLGLPLRFGGLSVHRDSSTLVA